MQDSTTVINFDNKTIHYRPGPQGMGLMDIRFIFMLEEELGWFPAGAAALGRTISEHPVEPWDVMGKLRDTVETYAAVGAAEATDDMLQEVLPYATDVQDSIVREALQRGLNDPDALIHNGPVERLRAATKVWAALRANSTGVVVL